MSNTNEWRRDSATLARRRRDRERAEEMQIRTLALLMSMEARLEEMHSRLVSLERRDRIGKAA